VSNKKTALDILGETHLPSDLLTPTEGLNGLMDTYPDLDYGAGVLNQLLPEASGHESGLPDGVVRAEDEGFGHLGEFLKEGSLADLSWLEVADQEADRLPENPVDLAIPELEEAWGVDRRTTGVRTTAYDLEEVKYRQAAEDTSAHPKATRKDMTRLAEVLRKAMRRSAAGASLSKIKREAAAGGGEHTRLLKQAMQVIEAEHGLAGNVFIRAEAYPGYEQGRWNDHLKRVAGTARYIIVAKDQVNAAHHFNGICTITGKKVVTRVPWKAAYSHYAPRLRASGRKVANNPKDPCKVLRKAFAQAPKGPARIEADRPTHVAPVDRVSSEQAAAEFAAAPAPERRVFDRKAREVTRARRLALQKIHAWRSAGLLTEQVAAKIMASKEAPPVMLRQAAAVVLKSKGASAFSGLTNDFRPSEVTLKEAQKALAAYQPVGVKVFPPSPLDAKRKKAHLQIAQMVRTGMLTREDGSRLVQSKARPRAVLETASALVNERALKQGAYSGHDNTGLPTVPDGVTRETALAFLKSAEDKAAAEQKAIDGAVKLREYQASRKGRAVKDLTERCVRIAGEVDKGLRGEALAREIRRNITAEEQVPASLMLASMMRERDLDLRVLLQPPAKQARSYDGPAYKVAQAETREVAARPQEIRGLLKWALQKMNEGIAGDDLNTMLGVRFSKKARTAAAADLRDLRARHEGLAGHIYVDSAAYASKTGMRGCEKGGLQHRSNVVPTVMEMSRCASCTRRVAKADGTAVCQVYNKPLVTASDLPVDDIKAYQEQSIKAANSSDAELTASLFAPGYDPNEFHLAGVTDDEIGFEDVDPSESLSGVVFGGMEW
jgi:hypothetical protein